MLNRTLQKPVTDDPLNLTRHFSEDDVSRAVTVLTVLFATLLLIGAILGLYFVHSPGIRLAMVAVFTIIFALTVGVCTSAKRAEVFGATAAYAAVLVVFVSGGLGAGGVT